jgi:CDP-diacylglycerol--glycerol-3-phosphate 3-phosphatidyltransferase
MWNIPNTLTLFRLLLIPVFIFLIFTPAPWSLFWAAFTFWLASVTDMLDGYLARKLKQSTPFGAFLDPVADKVMVSVALIVLTHHYQSLYLTIPTIIIISREIIVSALREWMAEIGERANVAVSEMGKIKTAAQMLAIIGLIWQYDSHMVTLSFVLFYVATILTFVSMLQYLIAGWGTLSQNKSKPGD